MKLGKGMRSRASGVPGMPRRSRNNIPYLPRAMPLKVYVVDVKFYHKLR